MREAGRRGWEGERDGVMMEASGEDIALKMHTGNPYGFQWFSIV